MNNESVTNTMHDNVNVLNRNNAISLPTPGEDMCFCCHIFDEYDVFILICHLVG